VCERERGTQVDKYAGGLAVGEGNQFNMQTGGMVVDGAVLATLGCPPRSTPKIQEFIF